MCVLWTHIQNNNNKRKCLIVDHLQDKKSSILQIFKTTHTYVGEVSSMHLADIWIFDFDHISQGWIPFSGAYSRNLLRCNHLHCNRLGGAFVLALAEQEVNTSDVATFAWHFARLIPGKFCCCYTNSSCFLELVFVMNTVINRASFISAVGVHIGYQFLYDIIT